MAPSAPTSCRQDMALRVIGNPKRAPSTFGETITKQAWWSRFNFFE